MMRETTGQGQAEQIAENPQHSHDFFVVSSCKVHVKLSEDIDQDSSRVEEAFYDKPIVQDFTGENKLKGEAKKLYNFIGEFVF